MTLKMIKTPRISEQFQYRLDNSNGISDVTKLISDINNALKNKNSYDSDDRIMLTSIRQKAYDRKKKMVVLESLESEEISEFQSSSEEKIYVGTSSSAKFLQFRPMIIASGLGLVSSIFLYFQSVPLYESVGFPYPRLCAIGALIMVIGFSLMHSLTRSKLLLCLCIYASVYEMGLIVAGSIKNEQTLSIASVEQDSKLGLLVLQAGSSKENYDLIKSKYDDPSSDKFQNSWYREKFVVPAFDKYQTAETQTIARREELLSSGGQTWNVVLKIFYRLGLIFLCMISINSILYRKQKG